MRQLCDEVLDQIEEEPFEDVVDNIKAKMTKQYQEQLDQNMAELKQDTPDADTLRSLQLQQVMTLYVLSDMSRRGLIAIDLEKLKSCNDFWAGKLPGRGAQEVVNGLGYNPLGLKLEVLSELTQSTEYKPSLSAKPEREVEDWRNPGTFKTVNVEEVKQELANLLQEDLDFMQQFKARTVRDGTKGDEFFLDFERVTTDSDGHPEGLKPEDIMRWNKILKKVGTTVLGEFTGEEALKKRGMANELLGKRSTIHGDVPLYVTLGIRSGGIQVDKAYPVEVVVKAEDAENIPADDEEAEELEEKTNALAFEQIASAANNQMEIDKKSENIRTIFRALTGDQSAILQLVLLREQDRFPGNPTRFKSIVWGPKYQNMDYQVTWEDAVGIYKAIESRQSMLENIDNDPRLKAAPLSGDDML
jgi:hypothetical protein